MSKSQGIQAEYTTDGCAETIKSVCPCCSSVNVLKSEKEDDKPRKLNWAHRCDHVKKIKKYNHRWYAYYGGV